MTRLRTMVLVAVATTLFLSVVVLQYTVKEGENQPTDAELLARGPKQPTALIVYSYYESVQGRQNLEFFMRWGMVNESRSGIAMEYLFVVNVNVNMTLYAQGLAQLEMPAGLFEKLPPYARARMRPNGGMDFCAWDHAFRDTSFVTKSYDYYVIMNASIRGPYLPSFLPQSTWPDAFFDKITPGQNGTKLVGLTLSCEYDRFHMQSMLFATDSVGLPTLRSGLGCWDGYWTIVGNGEMSMARRFLERGYSLKVMQSSFRDYAVTLENLETPETQKRLTHDQDKICRNPYINGFDGHALDPLELIFVKMAYLGGASVKFTDLLERYAVPP